MAIPAGPVQVQVPVSAAAIGSAPMVALRLCHAEIHVPGKILPQNYPSEQRVCNLSLNSLQWSTAEVLHNRLGDHLPDWL